MDSITLLSHAPTENHTLIPCTYRKSNCNTSSILLPLPEAAFPELCWTQLHLMLSKTALKICLAQFRKNYVCSPFTCTLQSCKASGILSSFPQIILLHCIEASCSVLYLWNVTTILYVFLVKFPPAPFLGGDMIWNPEDFYPHSCFAITSNDCCTIPELLKAWWRAVATSIILKSLKMPWPWPSPTQTSVPTIKFHTYSSPT